MNLEFGLKVIIWREENEKWWKYKRDFQTKILNKKEVFNDKSKYTVVFEEARQITVYLVWKDVSQMGMPRTSSLLNLDHDFFLYNIAMLLGYVQKNIVI